ncbi:hypothetical protein BCR44DRAFT_1217392 [Catenaria anguillulae PL171]|uniref:F-box domain-containing protein n=1 Tax=Catenaria anguillulae PL171 TaxID=765915 RepID=A0A1Y2HZG3_9FUNG|nr:hypothetical protein BCR44DRAFT_1217392 [Catenaria anguillulae PL171]
MSTMHPFDILPVELLTDVLALAQPRHDLAATSRLTATLARANQRDRQLWFHYAVFDSTLPADADNPESRWLIPPFTRLPRLARFLKSRLRSASNDLAQPVERVVISEELFSYLYGNPGPFVRQFARIASALEPPWDPAQFQAMLQTQLGSYADSAPAPTQTHCALHTWSVFPDAFQLLLYCLGSNRLCLFSSSLKHLLNLMPMLASHESSTLPAMVWLQLALDNRPSVRQVLKSFAFSATAAGTATEADTNAATANPTTSLSFPHFVMLQALTEWNPSALEIVESQLGVNVPDFVTWLSKQGSLMQRVSDSIRDISSATAGGSRHDVQSTFAWMHARGVPRGAFSCHLCATATQWDVFRVLLLDHDIEYARSLPAGVQRRALGSHFGRWCSQRGQVDPGLAHLALDEDLLSEIVARKVAQVCIKEGNSEVMEQILVKFPGCSVCRN